MGILFSLHQPVKQVRRCKLNQRGLLFYVFKCDSDQNVNISCTDLFIPNAAWPKLLSRMKKKAITRDFMCCFVCNLQPHKYIQNNSMVDQLKNCADVDLNWRFKDLKKYMKGGHCKLSCNKVALSLKISSDINNQRELHVHYCS